jgi:hypothetical protein
MIEPYFLFLKDSLTLQFYKKKDFIWKTNLSRICTKLIIQPAEALPIEKISLRISIPTPTYLSQLVQDLWYIVLI